MFIIYRTSLFILLFLFHVVCSQLFEVRLIVQDSQWYYQNIMGYGREVVVPIPLAQIPQSI